MQAVFRGQRSVLLRFLWAACGLGIAGAAQADLLIPAGGATVLAGGSMDLACGDVVVEGDLIVDSGSLTGVRHFSIAPGASVQVTSGAISLSGNWSSSGSFLAGSGSVSFVDASGCAGAGGTISGNSTFNTLSLVSATGKTYRFAGGSTQTVNGALVIQGVPAAPIILRSDMPGQMAVIALTGSQSVAHAGADFMSATGAWIAPGLANALPNATVLRWFGLATGGAAEPIPALSTTMLCLLAAILLLGMQWRLYRQQRLARPNPINTSAHRACAPKSSRNPNP